MPQSDLPHLASFRVRYDTELTPWLNALGPQRRRALWFALVLSVVGVPAGLWGIYLAATLMEGTWFAVPGGLVLLFLILALFAAPFTEIGTLRERLEARLRPALETDLNLHRLPPNASFPEEEFIRHTFQSRGFLYFMRLNDGYSGNRNGVGFEMRNASIHRSFGRVTYGHFRGLAIRYTLPGSAGGKLLILPRRHGRPARAYDARLIPVRTGDRDFDRRFLVYAHDPDEARQRLSPDIRARLLALKDGIPRYNWLTIAMLGRQAFVALDTRSKINFSIRGNIRRPLPDVAQTYARSYGAAHEIADILRDL